MLVAGSVGGREHRLGELRAFLEDALEQVFVQLVTAVAAVMVLDVEHLMDHEADVTERSAVGVHVGVLC